MAQTLSAAKVTKSLTIGRHSKAELKPSPALTTILFR